MSKVSNVLMSFCLKCNGCLEISGQEEVDVRLTKNVARVVYSSQNWEANSVAFKTALTRQDPEGWGPTRFAALLRNWTAFALHTNTLTLGERHLCRDTAVTDFTTAQWKYSTVK